MTCELAKRMLDRLEGYRKEGALTIDQALQLAAVVEAYPCLPMPGKLALYYDLLVLRKYDPEGIPPF